MKLSDALLVHLIVFSAVCRCWMAAVDYDGALYLTPMIRAGNMDEARAACKVKPLTAGIESYSGYLTVDERHGSNMFFWFFPAMTGAADAPVLLWLQGGPGSSSLFGLFNEHGPFSVNKNQSLKLRNHTWVSTHSVLYVDNPVGTGYSFTGDDGGYSSDEKAVGLNLYEALVQFFTLFPEYQKNDFFATGESYAGKYVPAVAHTIHVNNPSAKVKINLKGLAIGNGLIDPVNQMVYGKYLYQNGFVDEFGMRKFEEYENFIRDQIQSGNNRTAAIKFYEMMLGGTVYPYPTLFQNLTGMEYIYNMMWERDPEPNGDWEKYVQEPAVRTALHVGQRPLNNGTLSKMHLLDDVMQSVSPWLSTLLESDQYRILLYSGQLDIVIPYPGTVCMVQSLKWSGSEHFKNATRSIWRLGPKNDTSDVAGYSTTYGKLTVLLVRDSGHMVPGDTPLWGLDLINRFTANKTF